jgi:hypothetical protein
VEIHGWAINPTKNSVFFLGKVVLIGNNEVLSSKNVDFTNVKWSPRKQRNGGIATIGYETWE